MSENIPFIGDYYETLGVSKDATAEQIKKSFRKLARECHPDVAGDDPEFARRFDRIRRAYETLSDPEQRARYDKRGQPRRRRGWTDQGYRMPGGFFVQRDGSGNMAGEPGAPRPGGSPTRSRRTKVHPSNTMDLNDIFGDFGFGAESGKGGAKPAGGGGGSGGTSGPPPDNRQSYGNRDAEGDRSGSPGSDITLDVDVPSRVAQRGGVVTLEYPRLRLTEDGRSVGRYDELHDLRLPPGARSGTTLRVPRMGNAGTDGSVGDLVCDLRVVPDPPEAQEVRARGFEGFGGPPPSGRRTNSTARGPSPRRAPAPAPSPPRSARSAAKPDVSTIEDEPTLDISVVEALLGGRVPVPTPSGTVKVSIPPGTSGGTRLRLRGRGPDGTDLHVQIRIVVPRNLDDESRALIERFAQLNPDEQRD